MKFTKSLSRTFLTIVIVATTHLAKAQTIPPNRDVCDPGLTGSQNSAMGYNWRGDRCEGLYALRVNSADIRLASLVETFAFDLQNSAPLTVQWSTIESRTAAVRLRAQSLRPRSYYRMDTSIDAFRESYTWPTEILGAIGLERDDVGVLGWFEHENGGERREVYLPLRIAQGETEARSQGYELALIPNIRLREISVTLTPMHPAWVEGEPIIVKKSLEIGYYPARQATLFVLPKPDSPGYYRLELACDLMPEGLATKTIWFYHSE